MVRAYKALPPASELWELFDYKPLTGELVWKQHQRYPSKVGTTAGSVYNNGYTVIELVRASNRHRYSAHRLIWLWVTGKDPCHKEVDHRDGRRSNNAFNNLRLASSSQNRVNKTKNPPKGYYFVKSRNKYHATIKPLGQKQVFLGLYHTEAEARAAYEKASLELHGEFSTVLR